MNETIKLFNSEAKVLLEYDLSRVQAIINALRNEAGSFAASMLSEYEHQLINAKRLEEDRVQREYQGLIYSTDLSKIDKDIE